MVEHKVLITTSGTGSRLGHLTKFTNKSLVRVGDKPVISYIIENYSKDTNFVITLGHYGYQVKDFLELTYPNRNFEFVEVENYDKEGSSLLASMKCAKDFLQCPFIFQVCDAIICDNIPKLDHDWVTGVELEYSDQYRTLNVSSKNDLICINEKGAKSYDLVCPGLVGIYNYKVYWDVLENILKNTDIKEQKQLSDCHVIQEMINLVNIKVHKIKEWYDTGVHQKLTIARKKFGASFDVLDKSKENIYKIENNIIKFFYDKDLNAKRVKREKVLKGLVPVIIGSRENFFKYQYVQGDIFSKSVNPPLMKTFLEWANKNLWIKDENIDITNDCKNFYKEKTIKRVDMFLDGKPDSKCFINGALVPPVKSLLEKVSDKILLNACPSKIHGDLILDNIIEKDKKFTLIDWRQDFAGNLNIGDLYYDLAKLNHNLIFNHDIVNNRLYTIERNEKGIECDILVKKNLLDCKTVLEDFIIENGYSIEKVKLLTSIIWINMAPLHDYPLNMFLFNFGKYNLFNHLNKV